MKADPILQELEAVKERLAAEANGDTPRFLDQMEAWLTEHPHAGPVVNSPQELQARLRARGPQNHRHPGASRTGFTIQSLPGCTGRAKRSIANGRPEL